MEKAYTELVIAGPFALVKGFLMGFRCGIETEFNYFFHRKCGIRRDTLAELVKEALDMDNYVHLCLENDVLDRFREAVEKAQPVVLEPLMSLEVVVPQESVREVIGDIRARRGKVLGMEQQTRMTIIAAHAPLAALFGYATSLRSLTQGRGTYSMQLYQYVSVSETELKKVVANS